MQHAVADHDVEEAVFSAGRNRFICANVARSRPCSSLKPLREPQRVQADVDAEHAAMRDRQEVGQLARATADFDAPCAR